jgi:choline dehydrogenase-like flavoprotein
VDACIIGSGAGGGVVAKALTEHGARVVLLEAGRRFDPLKDYTSHLSDWESASSEIQKQFRVPSMDKVTFGNPNTAKPFVIYGVGGGTLSYLAYAVRLDPDDFRVNSLDGVGIDWPITYEDLEPYYRKVEWEIGVSGQAENPWSLPLSPYPNPPFEFSFANKILKRGCDRMGIQLWPAPVARLSRPFDRRPMCIQCGNCSDGCMTRAKSSVDVTFIPKAEATGKADIRPESVVTRIKVDKKGKAKGVIYYDKNGVEHEQEAEVIIVSAGSIQSPRLLLNSRSPIFPDGLANSSGLVGKNFMQHLSVHSKALFSDRIDSFRGFFGGAISLDFAKTSSVNSFARGWGLEFTSGLKGPVSMAMITSGWGASHKDYMRKNFGHVAGIVGVGEQLPSEKNSVGVDPEVKDDYGMPVPRITLEPGHNDKLMLKAIRKNLKEIYNMAGAMQILSMEYKPGKSAHNFGTCRMGNNPHSSVVNSFCQTHDVPNLFVVDGSCFVTGGTANPSLTIQAIALRASEYIIQERNKGNL